MVEVTREWLDSISDEKWLTSGQQKLLDVWRKDKPYVGKQVPEFVAAFVEKCKGYRGPDRDLSAFKNP